MKRKRILLCIVVSIIVLLGGFIFWQRRNAANSRLDDYPYIYTQEELDAIKDTPREQCTCWVGADDPDAHCAIPEVCV